MRKWNAVHFDTDVKTNRTIHINSLTVTNRWIVNHLIWKAFPVWILEQIYFKIVNLFSIVLHVSERFELNSWEFFFFKYQNECIRVVRNRLQRAGGWKSYSQGPEEESARGKRQSPANCRIKRQLSQPAATELANMVQDRSADLCNPNFKKENNEHFKRIIFIIEVWMNSSWYFENGTDFVDVDPFRFQ